MAAEDETDSAPEETSAQPPITAESNIEAESEPTLQAAETEGEISIESVPTDVNAPDLDDDADADHEATAEAEPAVGGEFDPMDVLNAPVEDQKKTTPTPATKPEPKQAAVQPSASSNLSSGPAPTGTAGAALSAMAAMNRPAVPQARTSTQSAIPSAKATTASSTPARSLKELSPAEIVTILSDRPLYIALIAIVVLWLAVMGSRGCSDNRVPTYPVRGRVVFADGSPVRTGTIEFESQAFKNTNSNGRINEDGSFVLGTYESDDGAPAGEHRVSVSQWIISDPTVKHEKDHGKPVDPRFSRYETSGLTAKIQESDENNVTITVETMVRYGEQQERE